MLAPDSDFRISRANITSPLISILSHLNNSTTTTTLSQPATIHILYSTRLPASASPTPPTSSSTPAPETAGSTLDQILFLSRIRQIIRSQAQSRRLRISLELFVTDLPDHSGLMAAPPPDMVIRNRRIERDDLRRAVNELDGRDGSGNGVEMDLDKRTVCYVCGPPTMTDRIVAELVGLLRDGEQRVFFEKWW